VGLEPTSNIQQPIDNKQLTKNENSVLSTSLDKFVQEYPDLAELVKVWPELPEHIKRAIQILIQTHKRRTKNE
jgi:hypothetical protein